MAGGEFVKVGIEARDDHGCPPEATKPSLAGHQLVKTLGCTRRDDDDRAGDFAHRSELEVIENVNEESGLRLVF